MSLLSVVRDVCAVVGVVQPTTVMGAINSTRTMAEMLALANEMAQRIAYDTRDWTRLRQTVTLQGDGVADITTGVVTATEAFDLPANYQRMLLTSNMWMSLTPYTPMAFIADTDVWVNRRVKGYINSSGEWTILGGQIHIYPLMMVGQSSYFAYLMNTCVKLKSGGLGDSFTDDADSFVLGDRLLKLGMVWQWKANKGTSYAEDMATYSDALAVAMGHDVPSPIIIDTPRARGAYAGYR